MTEKNPSAGYGGGNVHSKAHDQDLDPSDKKDRLLEYHKQVNERRKLIAAKAEQRR